MNRRRRGRSGGASKAGKAAKKAGAAGPARLDLELEVRDFGPLQDARMRLRPLTVFVGPNDSGKSYAALLAHSAVSFLTRGPNASAGPAVDAAHAAVERIRSARSRPPIRAGGRKNEFLVSRRALKVLSGDAAGVIAAGLAGQIEGDFGVHPSSLVRYGRSRAAIKIPGVVEMSIPSSKDGLPLPTGSSAHAATAREALMAKTAVGVRAREAGGGRALACTLPPGAGAAYDMWSAYDRLLAQVLAATLDGHGHSVPAAALYIPAPRSGIMGAYKAVLISTEGDDEDEWDDPGAAPRIKGVAPRMKGVVYDLLASVLYMEGGGKGHFARAAGEIERDALRGKITLRRPARGYAPDVYYARGRVMPISQASSAASELAPLVLLLRHVAKRGDLLVVEEPESHMHPKNQAAVARCIVKLVRAGLNVIVTTHSTYIMERFSAYLRAGQMTAAQRSRVGIGKGLYLEADDIAPYLFEAKGNRTTVKAIDHSPREGISQEEFMRVNQALHEENIRADKFVG